MHRVVLTHVISNLQSLNCIDENISDYIMEKSNYVHVTYVRTYVAISVLLAILHTHSGIHIPNSLNTKPDLCGIG